VFRSRIFQLRGDSTNEEIKIPGKSNISDT
jgi:hypothetical protein